MCSSLSPLCNAEQWHGLDANGLVKLCDDAVIELLGKQVSGRYLSAP